MREALGVALGAVSDEEAVFIMLERGFREGPHRAAALVIFRTFRLPPHLLPSQDALSSPGGCWTSIPAFVPDAPWAASAPVLHPSSRRDHVHHPSMVVYEMDEHTFDVFEGVAVV